MMCRSIGAPSILLGLILTTATTSASLLRGSSSIATVNSPSRHRELQDLDANQLQFNLLLTMEVNYDAMGIDQTWAGGPEYMAAMSAADAWVNTGAQDVADAHSDFDAPFCTSKRVSTEWSAGNNMRGSHELLLKYTCTFPDLRLPPAPYTPQRFVQELDNALSTSELQGGGLNTLPQNNQFSFTSAVTKQIVFVEQDVNPVDTRFAFDNNYVLPFQLTWDFDTRREMATSEDYYAVQNATKDWIDTNWDQFYTGPSSTGRFERRTTSVRLITGSMYDNDHNDLYSQSITMVVELVVGANNVTHVPSVTEYTTTMRYFYKIADFMDILKPLLDRDSVLQNVQQTTYAITPSYNVATLEERNERNDAPAPDDLKPTLPSIAVVSISI